MCEGLACKPGRQEIAISEASLHADDPPICLKCRVCAQLFNIAMLLSVKRRGIISAMVRIGSDNGLASVRRLIGY